MAALPQAEIALASSRLPIFDCFAQPKRAHAGRGAPGITAVVPRGDIAMPRIDDCCTEPVVFTDNTSWLEEIDSRRSLSPEELLTRLEGMLDQGELTLDEIQTYINDYQR
jgi:hypothetical protein